MGMPKYAARRDENHGEIAEAFARLGFSVQDTSLVGGSFPDLVVGRHGVTWLVEIKQPNGKLRLNQVEFFNNWRGTPPVLVRTVNDVIAFSERQANRIK